VEAKDARNAISSSKIGSHSLSIRPVKIFQLTMYQFLSHIFSRIVKHGKQEWGWKPQYFPVPRDNDYYPEWQKLLHDTTEFNKEG